MELKLWLLDINYETIKGKPEIHLWGIDDQNRRILLIDKRYCPYIYIASKYKEKDRLEEIQKLINGMKEISKYIDKTAYEKKRFFGKEINTLKLILNTAEANDINKISKSIKKINEVDEIYEEDIRFSMQYIYDNGVIPSCWHKVRVKESQLEGAIVDKVYEIEDIQAIEEKQIPNFKIMSILTLAYNPASIPNPQQDPLIAIAISKNDGNSLVLKNYEGDKGILNKFINEISQYDPDIIFGYDCNRRDWLYLLGRAKQNNLKLSIDRMKDEPHPSLYGHISITGRSNIDLLNFSEEISEIKINTLENVAEYLKIEQKYKKIDELKINDLAASEEGRKELQSILKEKVGLISKIGNEFLCYAIEMSKLVGIPLDTVGAAAAGYRVENYIIKYAKKLNELVPKHKEIAYQKYVGGLVLSPQSGLHNNIAVMDFKSMYPNLMIMYNLSPDTYVEKINRGEEDKYWSSPTTGYYFKKEPEGFYKKLLIDLINRRQKVKEEKSQVDPNNNYYKLLDSAEKAIKILTNACYGYAGWLAARWYSKPVAESAADFGRESIKRAISLAKELNLNIIYGDTDSIFVSYEPDKLTKLTEKINQELKLEIKIDKIYKKLFFTEAKKKYVGLTEEGFLDLVGIEAVRGDWAQIAKEIQMEILKKILIEESEEGAIEFVKSKIEDLKNLRIKISELIIWKSLTKPIEKYEVNAPHVSAAKKLKEQGYRPTLGHKIGYIIIKGKGRLFEKAIPYNMASLNDVDIDYYVENQILAAAMRILQEFGISKERLS